MELLNCRFANRVAGVQWESKLVPYIRKYSMRNKSSIVTSAADGCGNPSSIRPMGNLPSRNHKGAEYKESFMFSNRSTISRGCSIATAEIAAVAALAAFVGGTSQVRASTVNFIQNGSFGTGNFTDWFTNPNVSLSVTNTTAASGDSYSALYQLNSNNEAKETYGDLKSYAVNLTSGPGSTLPGNTVNISWSWEFSNIAEPTSAGTGGMLIAVPFFTGAPSSNGPTGTFIRQYVGWTGLGSSAGYGTGSNAHFINESATYTVPSNAKSMYFDLGAPNTASGGVGVTGTLYLDNVSVTAVPESATLGLVAVGGMALVLIGRKRTTGRRV